MLLIKSNWSHPKKFNGRVWQKYIIGQFCLLFYIEVCLHTLFLFNESNIFALLLGICTLFKPGSEKVLFCTYFWGEPEKLGCCTAAAEQCDVSESSKHRRRDDGTCLKFGCTSLLSRAFILRKGIMSSLDVGVRSCTDAIEKLLLSSKMAICLVTTLVSASLSPFFLLHIYIYFFFHCYS